MIIVVIVVVVVMTTLTMTFLWQKMITLSHTDQTIIEYEYRSFLFVTRTLYSSFYFLQLDTRDRLSIETKCNACSIP